MIGAQRPIFPKRDTSGVHGWPSMHVGQALPV